MTIAGVTRELLVRYLDTWTPAALHAGKRATFAFTWSDADAESAADADADSGATGSANVATAEAALRVFAEFADLLRARRLAFVIVAPGPGVAAHLSAVQADLHTPSNLSVHALAGAPDDLLGAALAAAGAAGAPLLVCAHATDPLVRVATAGRPVELISVLPAGEWPKQRAELDAAGFPLSAGVEFVDGSATSLISFATGKATSLEAFKNALWSVDEYAGVRYRDPYDPDAHLLDISLDPHPGPLRRALLGHLDAAGPRTVTELRHFTLTETIYRASDATRVMTALLHAGTLTSDAPHGRLAGNVTVRPGSRRP